MFKKQIKKFISSKEGKIILIIVFITVLAFLRSNGDSYINEDGSIKRSDYLKGDIPVSLTAEIEDVGSEIYDLNVGERVYSDIQCEALYEEMYPALITTVLNGNLSSEKITGDLNFVKEIPGYPFDLTFYVKERNIFDADGKLITKSKGETTVQVSVSYEDWEKETEFDVLYEPAESLSLDEIYTDLENEILISEKDTRENEYYSLPSEIDGHRVVYKDLSGKRNPIILLVGVVAIIILLYGAKTDRDKEVKKRQEEIIKDYSTVIQKLVMYLSSGMNLRNAWIRIYEDYPKDKDLSPMYEEIGIMVNEIRTGISETTAYREFSDRIGIPEITRMTTLLTQNLKKGSTSLVVLLSQEASKAFEGRRQRARIKGEEAQTKLLAPMTLLMIVVLVIIMIPAFWGM